MIEHRERTYRNQVQCRDLVSFQVTVKETDLWVNADQNLEKETRDLVLKYRNLLETYIRSHPLFLTTLAPYSEDPYAPIMIRKMIESTRLVEVGPMAAVAGAIAQYVGNDLLELTGQVIIENGGDVYLKTNRKTTISIFAGHSSLSQKIGLVITPEQMPIGVCSSSGTIGHSLSRGSADAVCLLSSSAIQADAAATALGNRIQSKLDIDNAARWAQTVDGILGGVVIMDDRIAMWGEVELVEL